MFGGVGVCVVARQSLGVSSDTLLLLHELRRGWWKECHVIHSTHGLHFRGGDEVGRSE